MHKAKISKPSRKKHYIIPSVLSVIILFLVVFSLWYLHPRAWRGSVAAEAEDGEILDIVLELESQKSFFKPEKFTGSIFIDGVEYVSTFYAERESASSRDKPYPQSADSYAEPVAIAIPHDKGSWLQNLKAKLRGEKWLPFFVLKGHEYIENSVSISSFEDLLEGNTPEEAEIHVTIYKDNIPKTYTVRSVTKH